MSASLKLKWKKLVNQLRFMYEELRIVEELCASTSGDFQKYYEAFCADNKIDIRELNHQHAERIKELYGSTKSPPSDAPHTGSTDMAVHEEEGALHQDPTTGSPSDNDKDEMHEVFSKLFKKLAQRLHPDKLITQDLREEEKKELARMFTNAKQALEEKRYFILMDYAERLKVPLPRNFKQQTRWMKKEVSRIRAETAHTMRSYNYLFCECDTDEEKDKIVRQFIEQLFQVRI